MIKLKLVTDESQSACVYTLAYYRVMVACGSGETNLRPYTIETATLFGPSVFPAYVYFIAVYYRIMCMMTVQ